MSTQTLLSEIDKSRHSLGVRSVFNFKYKKKRVRQLNTIDRLPARSKSILYLMTREHRTEDNWALLYAQYLSLKNRLPIYVMYFTIEKDLISQRYEDFLYGGLKKVSQEFDDLSIPFKAFKNVPNIAHSIDELVRKHQVGALIMDFFPLKPYFVLEDDIKKNVKNIPIIQIDGHNIVPCWITSDKQEYSARTIRPKIHSQLSKYLTPFPPIAENPYKTNADFFNSLSKYEINFDTIDDNITVCEWAKPGYKEGIEVLEQFINKKLKYYNSKRNDPCTNSISDLSPWLHFGQISVQRCILEINKHQSKYPNDCKAFFEEAVIRRELSDNFCFYNKNYDNIDGAATWAQTTLDTHRKDTREYVYSYKKFEQSKTHDPLWNAAQNQLIKHGKIHGFMRMYWAKKILEWSKSPEEALEIAIKLNDIYSLDGHDPNGFVGIMWSICGVHDQGWRERPIFGKIRFMNFDGCKRKFDVNAYIKQWN